MRCIENVKLMDVLGAFSLADDKLYKACGKLPGESEAKKSGATHCAHFPSARVALASLAQELRLDNPADTDIMLG